MNSPGWERAIVFGGSVIFVLVWFVKNIDYENLVKWRNIVRKKEGNWTILALGVFIVIVLVAGYCVYWTIVHRLG